MRGGWVLLGTGAEVAATRRPPLPPGGGNRTTRQAGRAEEEGEGEVYWEPLTGSGEAGRRRGRLLGGRGD